MPRFCTALDHGQPCTTRALPGQAFCYGHHPRRRAWTQCAFFNRKGDRCGCFTMRGQDHCFTHSPRNGRVRHKPIPIVPRTRRQKIEAKWLIFSNLPLYKQPLP